jgi:hypothetical protein
MQPMPATIAAAANADRKPSVRPASEFPEAWETATVVTTAEPSAPPI